jgi:isoleucyl-tRNA synthetase
VDNYTVRYNATDDNGAVHQWTAFASFDSIDDQTDKLIKEYQAEYQTDPNFAIVSVNRSPVGDIDYDLIDRMRSIRDMCEMGHKVRAEVKIRNRQPLSTAYVLFTDKQVQNYMVYIDCKNKDYANVLGDELNVEKVVFIEDANQFTDMVLKPNYRVLGKSGRGKQGNALKAELAKMSFADRKDLYKLLENKEAVRMCDIDITLADIEVEFVSKVGYASASNKSGVIILDTNLNDGLLEKGFIADFKSALQNVRKELELELTDRVYIEIFCVVHKCNDIIAKYKDKLKRELLANEIALMSNNYDYMNAKKIEIDGNVFYVNVCKEN